MRKEQLHHWQSWCLGVVFVCGLGLGCSQADEGDHPSHAVMEKNGATSAGVVVSESADIEVPKEFQSGEERFNTFCARCHGVHARGTTNGPPLVHKIYEPSHHADIAFLRAAAQGVRAHHWEFGNMPKIEGASSDDVQLVIQYVRWLQREAGIY
ncbi:cytochrome c [Candidatus Nitronereus thalassa]|uniref:Cytochrome c n=1 Tax=Candidatus Nitronereus thalassa TaxID=3020898 RepID=A0ABU3K4Y8_9BACT|nr:cytochrome c [Candidatus Nitronereus thalassa]MDT7041475.1 cytochrome c [Candidatus Nitronereus thalassa]